LHNLLISLLILNGISYGQVRYEVLADSCILIHSEQVAYWQVGVVEQKPNDSPEIRKYLQSVGINKPASYCAAGQYYCFYIASKNLYKSIPIPKTAVANNIFNYGKKNGTKTIYEAKRHDLIVWRKRNSWQGHVERIIRVEKAGWVYTIGFNTSSGKGNQRDGEGVYIRKRNIKHPLGRLQIRGLYGFRTN